MENNSVLSYINLNEIKLLTQSDPTTLVELNKNLTKLRLARENVELYLKSIRSAVDRLVRKKRGLSAAESPKDNKSLIKKRITSKPAKKRRSVKKSNIVI